MKLYTQCNGNVIRVDNRPMFAICQKCGEPYEVSIDDLIAVAQSEAVDDYRNNGYDDFETMSLENFNDCCTKCANEHANSLGLWASPREDDGDE